MLKKEVLLLNPTQLVAHALRLEMEMTKSENGRGVSKKLVADYKFTLETLSNKFDLNLEELKELLDAKNLWEEGGK